MRIGRIIVLAVILLAPAAARKSISISLEDHPALRVLYGAQRVKDALAAAGIGSASIVVGRSDSDLVRKIVDAGELKPEGFLLAAPPGGSIVIAGADESGELYGCLELARRIEELGKIPEGLHFVDAPAFQLRGTCIGMQNLTYCQGGRFMNIRIRPSYFHFFMTRDSGRSI